MEEKTEQMSQFMQELQVLIDKYNIVISQKIEFPQYKQLPTHVQLALMVLQENKAEMNIQYLIKDNPEVPEEK